MYNTDDFNALRNVASIVKDDLLDISQPLVSVAEPLGVTIVMFFALLQDEINNTEEVQLLFRASALATKAFEYFMHASGRQWLVSIVQPILDKMEELPDLDVYNTYLH